MNRARPYRQYPVEVKNEIARTGNIYLFPALKIPRATAQHWLKRIVDDESSSLSSTGVSSAIRERAAHLEKELIKERALRELLETIRKVFPFAFSDRYVKSKPTRATIVSAIRKCLKTNSLARCLRAIGLSKSSYERWSAESSRCRKSRGLCERRSPTQLTADETKTLKELVTSRRYAHLAICSLHLLAQREGRLFCSLQTWYRYIRYFGWLRPWSSKPKKIPHVGFRANRVNQTWHIDVTVISLRPGQRVYLQAVIDSFSRYVLAWRVTSSIGAQSTIETIELAKQNSQKILKTVGTCGTDLMMDPGTENKNATVEKYLASTNMRRVLAQIDVRYSNSMIETLFNSLKNRFLYHQKLRTIADVERNARFYLNRYNRTIPKVVHKGATPEEVYKSTWSAEMEQALKHARKEAQQKRIATNTAPACSLCPVLPLNAL